MNLIVAVVLLTVMQASPPVPRQTSDRPNASGKNVTSKAQHNQKPPVTKPVENPTKTKPQQGDSGVEQPNNNEQAIAVSKLPAVSVAKDKWDFASFFLTALLVCVGIATLRAIWIQAKETTKAARATEKSAVATEQSAAATRANTQAFREAERAWIVEEIRFPDHIPKQSEMNGGVLMVGFVAKNVGKQPALVRVVQSRFHSTEKPLPDFPQYRQSLTTVFTSRVLVPGEFLAWECPLDEGSLDDNDIDRINGHGGRSLYLYTYGRIQYESIGLSGSNQFCYKWHNIMGFSFVGDKEEFRKGGPDNYNQHT